jgi:hypothetical protein
MDEAEQDLMLGESFKVPGQACSVGIFQFCLSYRLLSYALEIIIVFWSLDLQGGKVFFFWSNCRWRILPCLSPLQVVKKIWSKRRLNTLLFLQKIANLLVSQRMSQLSHERCNKMFNGNPWDCYLLCGLCS